MKSSISLRFSQSNGSKKFPFLSPSAVGATGAGATGTGAAEDGVSLLVRVQPRSSVNALNGIKAGFLSVKLTSPPVDGEANAALITFLSKLLKFKKSAIRIESGERSKEKRLKLQGISLKEVETLFEPLGL